MEDTMMYDGDQQRYLQLLATGGEKEVAVDASDIDSSDVASSNDIDSDSDEEEDTDVGAGISSVARTEGRGEYEFSIDDFWNDISPRTSPRWKSNPD